MSKMSARAARRAAERAAAKLAHKAQATTNPAIATAATIPNSTATPAQIAANRQNAKHSTGPQTPEGKAAVSQNRTIHGLNYNASTFRVLPCEDQSDYDNLVKDLKEEHEPVTPTEDLLVLTMAQHRWLFDRAMRLQETCFDPQTGQIADQKLFSLYMRYGNTHERAFHKCLNDLVKARNESKKLSIGFESASRLREKHDMAVNFHKLEYVHREWKNWAEKNDWELAKHHEKMQNGAHKAA
jgi:hypothetical protein